MNKDVATWTVQYLQIMDDEGNVANEQELPPLSPDDVRTMYWHMVRGRALDRKMLAMQRQGRLGTFASIEGQEACQAGSATQLREQDWMTVAFRENVAYLIRGVTPLQILTYWGGDERGSAMDAKQRTLPVAIPIASQCVHAVGLAYASKYFERDEITLTYFGDGATSEGEFHEALNLAADLHVPVIFFCQNNQYAISVPRSKQSHSRTLAQKAIAYDIPTIQVDGNDVFAVWKATNDAIARAKRGEGPSFIEAVTYRLGNHTTSDDYKHYRTEEEVATWRKKDPIDRLRKFMERRGWWNAEQEQGAWKHAEELVEAAVKEYEAIKPQPPGDIFDYTFATLPPLLAEQKNEALGIKTATQADKQVPQ
jgi:pyruvate dehydrogenase E1 component alpha subunit